MTKSHIVNTLEQVRVEAMIAADIKELRKVLSPDIRWIHSSGKLDHLEDFLERLGSGTVRYLSINREDVDSCELGDAVFVSGFTKMIAEVQGDHKQIFNRYCNLWKKTETGVWQMVYWQSTTASNS